MIDTRSNIAGGLANGSLTPARGLHAYAAAAAIGLAVYLIVLGPDILSGTSPFWDLPTTDQRAYMMGYRYFLHEPWHWPVFVTHTMNVPYPKSIAFTDSIPVWAFINKAIATVISPWGTYTARGGYLGLWYALVFALQPVVAVANLRALGHKSWGATIVTALLFVAAPAWTMRFVHASMSAHFLTLWALYLYLRTPSHEATPRTVRSAQIVQLAIASLVNPYHTVMSFGLFAASVLRARRVRELGYIPVGVVTIGLGLWFAGYFASDARLSVFGFDVASTNVLSAVIPYHSGFIGDAAWVDPTGFQYEGVAYLGVGFLVLVALFVPRFRSLAGVIGRHRFLFAVALGAWLFALSTHIYIGGHELVSYHLPSFMKWLADQFRSPGRFVWLPMYVGMVFVLHEAMARFTGGWKLALLPVLAVLQVVDASGDWKLVHELTREPERARIELAAWRTFVEAHEAVFIHPSYDCALDGTKDMDHVSVDIQYLASAHALPINGVYSARPTRNCGDDELALSKAAPQARALYVFLKRDATVAYRFEGLGAACGQFTYGRVCSLHHPAIEAAMRAGILTPPVPPQLLAYRTKLELTSQANAEYFGSGWSWPDEHARWTAGPVAGLAFQLTGDPPPSVALALQAASVICGRRRSQHVDVKINGVVIGGLDFTATSNDLAVVHSLPIAHPELLRAPVVILELWSRDTRPLDRVGCNSDPRGLGVLVQSVAFE